MQIFNNICDIVITNLKQTIAKGGRVSIAAIFLIHAELRFVLTSQTLFTEKAPKEQREFYIPRLNREHSLYRLEYEIDLRNKLCKKIIANECVGWICLRPMTSSGCLNYIGRFCQIAGYGDLQGSEQAGSFGRPLLMRNKGENAKAD